MQAPCGEHLWSRQVKATTAAVGVRNDAQPKATALYSKHTNRCRCATWEGPSLPGRHLSRPQLRCARSRHVSAQTLSPRLELLTAVESSSPSSKTPLTVMHTVVSSSMQPRYLVSTCGYVSPQISRVNYTRHSRTLADPLPWKRFIDTLFAPSIRRSTIRGSASVVTMSSDKEAITAVLNKYETALNESSTAKVRPGSALQGDTLAETAFATMSAP